MTIHPFVFGPFQTNTYVVSADDEVLLIDPACLYPYEQQQLLEYINSLAANGRQLKAILTTHGHLDHLWGAAWASEQWNLPILIPEADIPMVQAMQQQYDLFGIPMQAQAFPIEPLHFQFSILHSQFSILPTPGHTPGSICLYSQAENLLFSGDTLFRYGYGRTDLPGGNYGQLLNSLEQLFSLPPATRVYPGHGEFTTIAAEKR